MAKKKWKKQKRNSLRLIAVIFGGILLMIAFVLSLRGLSAPLVGQEQNNNEAQHINNLLIDQLLMQKNYKPAMAFSQVSF